MVTIVQSNIINNATIYLIIFGNANKSKHSMIKVTKFKTSLINATYDINIAWLC